MMELALLDIHNSLLWDDKPLGEYIREQGYEKLWNDRPAGSSVDTIIIHYMSAIDDVPQKPFDTLAELFTLISHKVSAHYLISQNGRILSLVPEASRAWHAGGSIMPLPDLRRDVNNFSIGIELSGTHDSGFTQFQYESLAALCAEIEMRWSVSFKYIGHEHVASSHAVALGLRETPKFDPGPLFDWEHLRALLKKDQPLLAQRV